MNKVPMDKLSNRFDQICHPFSSSICVLEEFQYFTWKKLEKNPWQI